MRKFLLAFLGAVTLSSAAQAQTFDNVTFDCTGALTKVVETPEGVRATGNVRLTMDLPNGATWDSAGLIVLQLSPQASRIDVDRRPLRRCRGRGSLNATVVDEVKGVEIFELMLVPSQVQVNVGNRRITDPTAVEFSSTADGSPNI